jgi:phenylpyruvate tautomerase PptA (4-oxalocrotonate tautomerase family)
MPVCFIEAPRGLSHEAKKKLLENAGRILHETFQRDDERVFLHEYDLENTSQDAKHASEVRPVCRIEVPAVTIERRRSFVKALDVAVGEAYGTTESLIFVSAWPLENVANGGRLIADLAEVARQEKSLA